MRVRDLLALLRIDFILKGANVLHHDPGERTGRQSWIAGHGPGKQGTMLNAINTMCARN